MTKIYPESGIELTDFTAKNYDKIMNLATLGFYKRYLDNVIGDLEIKQSDNILDLGCGTGRNAKLILSYLGEEGKITGLDISKHMEEQFLSKLKHDKRASFTNQRIDIPIELNQKFDKIFISFVIHGFPHEVRKIVIQNAFNHLKEGGTFIILDFAEFDMAKMPAHHRYIFKKVECSYAFDYIEKDWKEILSEYGFSNFEESFHLKNYVRLLKAKKI